MTESTGDVNLFEIMEDFMNMELFQLQRTRLNPASLLLVLSLTVGCSTAQTSNTARTSTEQLLVSNAVDQSLDKVNFSSFNGAAVFLDEKYVDCVDKSYVVSSVRHRLLTNGARLVDAADKSDVVVELRAGAVGTTSAESYVGIPEIVLPGMLTLPEVRFFEKKSQSGTAKLGLVAYNPKTGAGLGLGGMSLAKSDDNNWSVAGVGPFQNGSIRREVNQSTTGNAGMMRNRLPVTVAFDAPPIANAQYAEDTSLPVPGIDQASHAEPDWAKGEQSK